MSDQPELWSEAGQSYMFGMSVGYTSPYMYTRYFHRKYIIQKNETVTLSVGGSVKPSVVLHLVSTMYIIYECS